MPVQALEPVSEKLKILVVEDDQSYRRMAREVLEGHERHIAGTAAEGLEFFLTEQPDITFLDIGLPDESGLKLLQRLKAHDPDAFVVMLTASRQAEDIHFANGLSAAGYIVKPFSRGKVREQIDAYHDYRHRLATLGPKQRQQLQEEFFARARQMQGGLFEKKKREAEDRRQALMTTWRKVLSEWHVLIVDGGTIPFPALQDFLELVGCTVEIVPDGPAALDALRRRPYQLALVNEWLPECDGGEAAYRLRTNHATLPLMLMVDSAAKAGLEKWKRLRLTSILTAPLDLDAALEGIEQLLIRNGDPDHIFIR